MIFSKSATLSVILAVVLINLTPIPLDFVFLIAGFGVTVLYRAVKGCFNFMNPPAVAGVGAVVAAHLAYANPVISISAGIVLSFLVGIFAP